MKRLIYQELIKWKDNPKRKPLVLNGARQVGKTYILREFAKNEYKHVVYFSLDREDSVRDLFERVSNPNDIIMSLSAISGVDIKQGSTIVVLDEIQECPKALTALKFFQEDMPELDIAVAGSLLGLSLHSGASFPVGKVDMLYLYPMNFEEFLLAMGKDIMVKMLRERNVTVIESIREEYIGLLRQYYYVGGMPAVVSEFVSSGELQTVRRIQQSILQNYRRDFSKHAPEREIPRINMVWDSIPSQLVKENKKFIYGAMRKGARAADFEMAIEWLIDAGLIYKVNRVKKPVLPLKFYEDMEAFKLFMLDIGLLGAMVEAPAKNILVGNDIFKEYKGAFTELYVHNELKQREKTLYYHSVENSTIEIDFLVQSDDKVLPIEVKAEENVKAKSLRTFIQKYPDLKGIRISMKGREDQEWLLNLPLYDFCHDV